MTDLHTGPIFPPGLSVPVRHARTGATYHLIRMDALDATPERLDEVVAACNETQIHRWLFAQRLGHEPYSAEMAADFLRWAREGWAAGTHFVFGLLGPGGELAAVLDIKSAEPDGAEVGYWLRAAHSGVMTNALAALVEQARAAGYRSLFAQVRQGNARSAAVLTRTGFTPEGGEDFQGHPHERFTLKL